MYKADINQSREYVICRYQSSLDIFQLVHPIHMLMHTVQLSDMYWLASKYHMNTEKITTETPVSH
jgi:hypothetical protein